MRHAIPMVFVTLDTGCYVCLTHKLNADGYLRKTWGSSRKPGRVAEFFHRFIWRAHRKRRAIPKGMELHHTCEVRACCNPDHLQLLMRTAHLRHTNMKRYCRRREEAKASWLSTPRSGTKLAQDFGVTFSAACGWIRQWKLEANP